MKGQIARLTQSVQDEVKSISRSKMNNWINISKFFSLLISTKATIKRFSSNKPINDRENKKGQVSINYIAVQVCTVLQAGKQMD